MNQQVPFYINVENYNCHNKGLRIVYIVYIYIDYLQKKISDTKYGVSLEVC